MVVQGDEEGEEQKLKRERERERERDLHDPMPRTEPCLWSTSGAKYCGVPQTVLSLLESSTRLASPKSLILISTSEWVDASKMFSGFKSLCATPCW